MKPDKNVIRVSCIQDVPDAVESAVSYLHQGIPFIIPTDTVYGIAASINADAVEQLLNLKQYNQPRPLACLVSDLNHLKDIIVMDDIIGFLLDKCPPGQITIIAKLKQNIDKAWHTVSAGDTIGFRIPNNDFLQQVLRAHGQPIVASSANIRNNPPEQDVQRLAEIFPQTPIFDVQINEPTAMTKVPSTIVNITGPFPRIIRLGSVSSKEINRLSSQFFQR